MAAREKPDTPIQAARIIPLRTGNLSAAPNAAAPTAIPLKTVVRKTGSATTMTNARPYTFDFRYPACCAARSVAKQTSGVVRL